MEVLNHYVIDVYNLSHKKITDGRERECMVQREKHTKGSWNGNNVRARNFYCNFNKNETFRKLCVSFCLNFFHSYES
jgi:hypothetical protein